MNRKKKEREKKRKGGKEGEGERKGRKGKGKKKREGEIRKSQELGVEEKERDIKNKGRKNSKGQERESKCRNGIQENNNSGGGETEFYEGSTCVQGIGEENTGKGEVMPYGTAL